MKIIDCTTYYEEDLMMEIRFNIMDRYVDNFLICEAKFSHSGNKKKINFNPNNYPKFKNKITHIVMENDPCDHLEKNSNFTNRDKSIIRIAKQRNFIQNHLKGFSDNDIVIHSDNDEIPDLSKINFSDVKEKIIMFNQKLFYYKLNLLYPNFSWFGSKACRIRHLKSFDWLRFLKNKKYNFFRFDTFFSRFKERSVKIVNKGGWHFSNLKTAEDLQKKYLNDENYSEYLEQNIKKENIEDFIFRRVYPHNHFVDKKSHKKKDEQKLIIVNENELPLYLIENKKKYSEWILN